MERFPGARCCCPCHVTLLSHNAPATLLGAANTASGSTQRNAHRRCNCCFQGHAMLRPCVDVPVPLGRALYRNGCRLLCVRGRTCGQGPVPTGIAQDDRNGCVWAGPRTSLLRLVRGIDQIPPPAVQHSFIGVSSCTALTPPTSLVTNVWGVMPPRYCKE